MARNSNRRTDMRARIAAAAARLMAEDGIDDFALAKRKAARQLGAAETESLPRNDEIEAELRAYRALYQADEHPQVIDELRRLALDAMRALERFSPYLTGPVLKGIAGPYAEISGQHEGRGDLSAGPKRPLYHPGDAPLFGRPTAGRQSHFAPLAGGTAALGDLRSKRRASDPQNIGGWPRHRAGRNSGSGRYLI